ncbi:TIGR03936 family radical SAM-associated protein [Crassaminicella profunda]|uniref:TIGR03936 family radical SAM-associated protein n=1 Tax=Crassaminicella profunda TaxID=1286698 RepID=UPI001CA66C84|nr:TIGR03936 family radical SAM-associated protein [Crassaminicella profunda]QZY56613.1 TIGR03936 family radical SAM-associated protein [Crassaminicella profunda]
MYKIRMRFSKKDFMIFISHLDLARVMERALRRAEVSLSFSQGFNPHPKISFATALALGVSSDGEYVDVEIEEKIDLKTFKDKINMELPEGIEVIQCKYIDVKSKALMAIIEYSTYMVRCSLKNDIREEELKENISEFMKNEEIIVYKTIKKRNKERNKEINIRPLIKKIEFINKGNEYCVFKMTLATGSRGNLKPEVVMEKLKDIGKMPIVLETVRIHRLDLYGMKAHKMIEPLELSI